MGIEPALPPSRFDFTGSHRSHTIASFAAPLHRQRDGKSGAMDKLAKNCGVLAAGGFEADPGSLQADNSGWILSVR
jgi:hypothetical protein